MGYSTGFDAFNKILVELSKGYKIYAPVKVPGKGAFSDTDLVTYREINKFEQIELNEKTRFSPKEILSPITQTLFYFTEDKYSEPGIDEKGAIIFCRPCDVHAVKPLDEIFLHNGPYVDHYYQALRQRVKFFVLECVKGFETCFCVSTGTNKVDDYDVFLRVDGDLVVCDVKGDLTSVFEKYASPVDMTPGFIEKNNIGVNIPDEINSSIYDHDLWKEYSSRCVACGRCTVSCPTCSCFTMQDIFYEDNPNCGERRRVWASCMIDGFTDMAGGHGFRKAYGDRLRFKVMHKIYDFRKRFGHNMCVGCGRCDDVCPEYISFVKCIEKINSLSAEVK